jgi:putative serine protease PepD
MVSIIHIITANYYVQHAPGQIENNNNTLTLSNLYSKVEKSVVGVTYSNLSESNVTLPKSLILSGFVYDKDGHIITNAYGLTDHAQRIDVIFPDHVVYPASLVGSDLSTYTAVLDLKGVPKNRLIPLPLGNSTGLSVGEQVATIGSPYEFSGSLNTGIIS